VPLGDRDAAKKKVRGMLLSQRVTPRLAFSLGRKEVVFPKRHENGTLVQTGFIDYCKLFVKNGSSGWIRTSNPPVNSVVPGELLRVAGSCCLLLLVA
jgi:hypothetical protein